MLQNILKTALKSNRSPSFACLSVWNFTMSHFGRGQGLSQYEGFESYSTGQSLDTSWNQGRGCRGKGGHGRGFFWQSQGLSAQGMGRGCNSGHGGNSAVPHFTDTNYQMQFQEKERTASEQNAGTKRKSNDKDISQQLQDKVHIQEDEKQGCQVEFHGHQGNNGKQQQQQRNHHSSYNDYDKFRRRGNFGRQPQRNYHSSYDNYGEFTEDGGQQQTGPQKYDNSHQGKYNRDTFRKNWRGNNYRQQQQPHQAWRPNNKKDLVSLSKSVSYLLRHGAHEAGLNLQSDGFAFVHELLQCNGLHRRYTKQDVHDVAMNDNKQRYQVKIDPESKELMIRANQGHTIEVPDLQLEPISDPSEAPVVIHGTFLNVWQTIEQEGLSRMSRNHIHFSVGKPGDDGVISGMRKNCQVLIYIGIKKAMEDGIPFFRSANNVILSPGDENGFILPKYFARVDHRFTGRREHMNSKQHMHWKNRDGNSDRQAHWEGREEMNSKTQMHSQGKSKRKDTSRSESERTSTKDTTK